ncbi:MAG: insulinase family protein [Bacteroides sp.]|nr:insulinase family protein [Bacteroides sp.]
MNHKYNVFTLGNGLRVVNWHRDGLVSYIGFVVNAGSRDEDTAHFGLAHFVEHTIFKGTDKRRGWQISSRMEVVGGELNAYTSKEETMVYTNAPAGYEERAIELLADLVMSSRFPADDIDREREVIAEEINSYLDSPSDSVYDEFEEHAYAGSGLAHNILGTHESIKHLSGSDCRNFLDRYYTPSNMVMYCATSMDPDRLMRLVERYFGLLHFPHAVHTREVPPPVKLFDIREDRGNHQANTIVGSRVFGRRDPRRFALFLLNNYLGGPCMNSRLNREMREKRGYVYTVDSNVSLMSDSGLLLIYFGSDPSTVGKCRRLIDNELDRLANGELPAQTFEKIKRQYCGQLLVSSDHIENRAMSLAKSLLYFDSVSDISTMAENIMTVTPAQVREVAELLVAGKCGALTII